MLTTGVDLVDQIHKAWYTVMSLAFPLPFKVDNQAIWQNHTEILYHVPLCCSYISRFHLKQSYKYLGAIVSSTNPKQLYKDASFPDTASACLSKYDICKKK